MPNCFVLRPKGQVEPAILSQVDEAICKHFNVPVHDKYWHHSWYDVIGLMLAMGRSFDQIEVILNGWIAKAVYAKDHMQSETERKTRAINAYLRENYTPDAWYELKR